MSSHCLAIAFALLLVTPALGSAADVQPPETVDTGSRITEQNDTYWRFAWQITYKNPNRAPIVFDVEVQWIDEDGYVIRSEWQRGISLGALDRRTQRGSTLIPADVAPNVVGFESYIEMVVH